MPLLLGEFQFTYIALLAILTSSAAYHFPQFYNAFPHGTFPDSYKNKSRGKSTYIITRPTKHIIITVLPLGVFQFVGKYFGHKATALVPVSTVSSIKTLSPLFILLVQKLFRIQSKISLNIIISLCCIICGVYSIVWFDANSYKKTQLSSSSSSSSKDTALDSLKFSSGLIAATISMLVFVFQNIYGKKVFTYDEKPVNHNYQSAKKGALPVYQEPTTKWYKASLLSSTKKYDKMTLMVYISLFGFCSSFLWFVTLELPLLWQPKPLDNTAFEGVAIPWRLLFVNGTLHFIQAMIAYYLLGQISTLSYSISNLMKRIVIIVVSWAISSGSSSFSVIQFLGLFLNAVGLFLYNRSK
ncbi:hypothetical protein ACO0QE_002165 [Hanseniaspora vineae]